MPEAVTNRDLGERMVKIETVLELIAQRQEQQITLSETVVRMQEEGKSTLRSVERLFKKSDEAASAIDAIINRFSLLDEKMQTRVDLVDRKVDGLLNRIKGGLWVGGICWVLMQGAVFGGVAWLFQTASTNKEAISDYGRRLTDVERRTDAYLSIGGKP